jgi:hypothetical protein
VCVRLVKKEKEKRKITNKKTTKTLHTAVRNIQGQLVY